ncbi:hypothetical protein [Aeromicrobium marinum]|nr:hypothetical protein [Aeromicrobium marinum]
MSLPFDIRATVDDGVVHLDLDGQTLAKTKPAVHAALLAWLGAHDIGATEIPSLARITVNTADGTITFPMITQVDGELVVVNGELHRTLTTRRPSKVQPFPTELQELVECTHPDAFDVRLLCEDATTSRCPDCGHTWTTAEPIDTEGDDLA